MKDFHLHTRFGDGKNSVNEMVKAATEAGFCEIAFTEHFTWFFTELKKYGIGSPVTIMPEEIFDYFAQCRDAEQKYGIKVLKGFEIGYLEKDRKDTLRLIEKVKPDLLLLAVHHLELLKDWKREDGSLQKKGWSLYASEDTFAEMIKQYGGFHNVCERYFKRLNNAVEAGFENLAPRVGVAHLCIFESEKGSDRNTLSPYIDNTIENIANRGLALELNFHYFQSHKRSRPDFVAARIYKERGGKELWFGSDSHTKESIAQAAELYPIFQDLLRQQDFI